MSEMKHYRISQANNDLETPVILHEFERDWKHLPNFSGVEQMMSAVLRSCVTFAEDPVSPVISRQINPRHPNLRLQLATCSCRQA